MPAKENLKELLKNTHTNGCLPTKAKEIGSGFMYSMKHLKEQFRCKSLIRFFFMHSSDKSPYVFITTFYLIHLKSTMFLFKMQAQFGYHSQYTVLAAEMRNTLCIPE